MSNGGIPNFGGSRRHIANLLRFASDERIYDGDLAFCRLTSRGKVRQAAEYANDPDNSYFRARRSRGWKSHKHRRQWEHGFIEAQKHADNRSRKAEKRPRKRKNRII